MDERTEKAYSPKEMFTTLDIGDSTLRKWCIALEKNGYGFIRNDQNRRIYVEGDLVVLRHFQNLIKQHNMQLDNAAILVIDRFGKGAFEVGTLSVLVENEEEQREISRSNDEDIKELKALVMEQNDLIKNLVARMDQQQKYIDQRLEKRDRKLMESLKESQEERKALLQIAVAQEEEKKKGFFARLFRK
jgi:Protein of unknown function (DUF3967)